MKKIIARFVVCAVAVVIVISCGKKALPPAFLPPLPGEPEMATVSGEPEPADEVTADEAIIEEEAVLRRILVPYTKEYLTPGQETAITARLENGDYGDEAYFEFMKEPGKNSIEVEGRYNTAVIRAVGEGEQYIRVSHPKARESRIIVYDVLPPSPTKPPDIDVSESPMIIRKGETKPLRMALLNGMAADVEKFQFQVVENAYAIEVQQHGDTLQITGIAPGAGKIRIRNPAALRDYDVMVIVD
jgi:hypothetical protein